MDLLVIVFLLFILYKAEFVRSKRFNNEYLSADTSKTLKGICAIAVIIHHLSQNTDSGGFLFNSFESAGHLAVSLFFFFSGFGVQHKYITDKKYLNNFLPKRLIPIIIPYIIMTIVCWVTYLFCGKELTLADVLKSQINGDPVAIYSWFALVILLFYTSFYIVARINKNSYNRIIVCEFLLCILWFIACTVNKFGSWWYISCFALVLGMIWATHREKITTFAKKRYRFITPICTALFLLLFHALKIVKVSLKPNGIFERNHLIALYIASGLIFVITVLLLCMKIKLKNTLFNKIADYSFELYLVQGLFIYIFGEGTLHLENEILFCTAVIICSAISAVALHMLCKFIASLFFKFFKFATK